MEGVLCWTGSCFLREARKYLLRLDVLNLRSPTPEILQAIVSYRPSPTPERLQAVVSFRRSPTPERLQAVVSSPLIGFAGADHPLRSLAHPLNLWHLNLWQHRSDRANCPSRLMTVE